MAGQYDDMISDSQYGGASGQYTRMKYPNPFFDLSRHYFPKSVKSLLKSCKTFFYRNEFIHNIILKLAEYPVTDILIDKISDPDAKEKYYELINHHLKIKSLLVEIGLDYFAYGNCFISANMKFNRFMTCPKCKESHRIEQIKYKFVNFVFKATCPACKASDVVMKVTDKPIKSHKFFNLIRWAPENIDIEYNELTGESVYYYLISEKTRKGILAGKRDVIDRTPMMFLDAIHHKKKIQLDPRNLYHFKRVTLAEEDQGWGKSAMLPVMPILWYMQTLRRGNEAIVADHLIPMRAVFPQPSGTMDPFTSINLGNWRSQVEDSLIRWRRDNNYIATFPQPVGYQSFGADAKMLMVTPEMEYLKDSIINSFGLPVEFIKGGATWTSSSVSLRIVENHFLQYREQLEDFLNYFVVEKIAAFLDYPTATLKLQKLKMIDDVAMKQQINILNQQGKLSDASMLEEFGFDGAKEREIKSKEQEATWALQSQEMLKQGEAQAKVAVINAKAQAQAQYIMQEESFRIRERLFEEELVVELGARDRDPSDIIEKTTAQLTTMDENSRMAYIQKMGKSAPTAANFIMFRINTLFPAPTPMEDAELEAVKAKAIKDKKTTSKSK